MQLHERPKMKLWVNGKSFEGILDTGADISIVSSYCWPHESPLKRSDRSLLGLGYNSNPEISTKILSFLTSEGQRGTFRPHVLPLPVNLWGRDIMQQLQLTLSNTPTYSQQAQNMIMQMGYVPGRGLGKGLQGIKEPVQMNPNNNRSGLGFS
ncbi:endogenous retrovirus group K member 21 Pro protein-like [Nannospalax galili]|uniref:endogenous retrovirus group K member 21 Pro protein-like n=1 Tax=Nannospalax galili TaxID=1026970 RepID=UPI00111C2D1D|nr:endogenous retrovirus group K member 21 Pro protein-like [Nannospalax galili]